jgi:predicted Holliday junction resolvase-like endonuclease
MEGKMQISYGFLTILILLSASAGAVLGSVIIALFSGAQVQSLQDQLNSKAEFWCRECHWQKRAKELNEEATARESYVKSLEQRIDQQRRSISAMGAALQKKIARVA